jgi:hypothetical protein
MHTQARARAYIHRHTHTCPHAHTHGARAHTHTPQLRHTPARTHAPAHTDTPARTHACMHGCRHTQTHFANAGALIGSVSGALGLGEEDRRRVLRPLAADEIVARHHLQVRPRSDRSTVLGCAVLRRVVPRYRRVATQRGTTRCNAGPLSGRPAPYRPVSLMLSYFLLEANASVGVGRTGCCFADRKMGRTKKEGYKRVVRRCDTA